MCLNLAVVPGGVASTALKENEAPDKWLRPGQIIENIVFQVRSPRVKNWLLPEISKKNLKAGTVETAEKEGQPSCTSNRVLFCEQAKGVWDT